MLIKVIVIAGILIIWGFFSYGAYRSLSQILKISEVDSKVTLRLVGKALIDWIPNPFSKLVGPVREKAELKVSLSTLEGYTFTPRGGETINSDFLRDRRQYSFVVNNESKEVFYDLRLRLQLPYPIESFEIQSTEGADSIMFKPAGMEVTVSGSGEVKVLRPPLSRNYEYTASEIRSGGRVEILFVLNSWRDPRGKTIPTEEAARYFIPEWGPTLTYIHGNFQLRIGGEVIQKEYYAPVGLREDKIVVLGQPNSPPEGLVHAMGFE